MATEPQKKPPTKAQRHAAARLKAYVPGKPEGSTTRPGSQNRKKS